jgi:hypothetical protein
MQEAGVNRTWKRTICAVVVVALMLLLAVSFRVTCHVHPHDASGELLPGRQMSLEEAIKHGVTFIAVCEATSDGMLWVRTSQNFKIIEVLTGNIEVGQVVRMSYLGFHSSAGQDMAFPRGRQLIWAAQSGSTGYEGVKALVDTPENRAAARDCELPVDPAARLNSPDGGASAESTPGSDREAFAELLRKRVFVGVATFELPARQAEPLYESPQCKKRKFFVMFGAECKVLEVQDQACRVEARGTWVVGEKPVASPRNGWLPLAYTRSVFEVLSQLRANRDKSRVIMSLHCTYEKDAADGHVEATVAFTNPTDTIQTVDLERNFMHMRAANTGVLVWNRKLGEEDVTTRSIEPGKSISITFKLEPWHPDRIVAGPHQLYAIYTVREGLEGSVYVRMASDFVPVLLTPLPSEMFLSQLTRLSNKPVPITGQAFLGLTEAEVLKVTRLDKLEPVPGKPNQKFYYCGPPIFPTSAYGDGYVWRRRATLTFEKGKIVKHETADVRTAHISLRPDED